MLKVINGIKINNDETKKKLYDALVGQSIKDVGIGFDGVEFGYIVLSNGDKIFLDKVEVVNITEVK